MRRVLAHRTSACCPEIADRTYGEAAVFGVDSGVGISLFMVWWETALAQGVPPAVLSRVSAFDWMGSLGLAPIGLVLAGPIAARFGAAETLAAGAALITAVNLAVAWAPAVREFRQPNSGTPLSGVEASA